MTSPSKAECLILKFPHPVSFHPKFGIYTILSNEEKCLPCMNIYPWTHSALQSPFQWERHGKEQKAVSGVTQTCPNPDSYVTTIRLLNYVAVVKLLNSSEPQFFNIYNNNSDKNYIS